MILSKSKLSGANPEIILKNKLHAKQFEEILLVFPTNRKVRYFTKSLLEELESNSFANLKIHTLSTLSIAIFNGIYNENYFMLDDATAVVKLKKIFSELELKYFPSSNEVTNGILLEVKNVISEFKRKGITSDLLKKDVEQLSGSESNKAEDLIKIYDRYKSECYVKKLFELGDIYEYIVKSDKQNFSQSFNKLFPRVNFVFISGFDELTNPEIAIINSIFDLIENSFIQFDYYDSNPELFSHIAKTIKKLEERGFKRHNEVEETKSSSFIKIVQENLFTFQSIRKNSDIELSLYAAQNRIDEVNFIANYLKKQLSEKSFESDKICVAFNQISNYSKVIDEIFDDYGIPYNLTDRFLLSDAPPVVSIINFLEILENNFYYKNIFRALSGKWIEISDIDKVNLLNVSVNLKIISNYDNWVIKIENVLEKLDSNSDSEFNYLNKESYNKALNDIKIIYDYLKPFEQLLTPKEFLEKISELILNLDIITKAVNESEFYVEKNTRAIIKFIELLNNLVEIIEIEYVNKKQSLSLYLDNIKSASQFTRYNVLEKPGVLITTFEEIRGLDFELLILGGLVDGEFPTRYSPEIFVPHKYKTLEEGHLHKERFKFYQALSTAKKSIIFTYPKAEETAELTLSSFINDLRSIVSIKNVDLNDKEIICSEFEIKKNIQLKDLEKFDKEFLVEFNLDIEDLAEKCEIDNLRRNNPFEYSEYNGFINYENEDELSQQISSLKVDKYFSASKLEEYVKCPYKFLLNQILKLKPFKEPKEEVEAFEIGTLIHSILFDFYTQLKDQNIKVENCSDQEFEYFVNLIFNIAESKINKENFDNSFSFFELEKILGVNGKREYSILYKFLEEERKSKNNFTPYFFEKKFGKRVSNDEVKVDDIHLQGSIDRVDVNFNDKLYSVIDYKLRGKTISKEDIKEGIALQLPLYLYAAKSLLEAEFNQSYEPYSAEIYSLRFSGKEFGRKVIKHSSSKKFDKEELVEINKDMINIFTETISKSIEKIKKGEFHLSSLKNREQKACKYCDFSSVCRVNEII